jgi:hypothetical protein
VATAIVDSVKSVDVAIDGFYRKMSAALLSAVADQVNEELLHDRVLVDIFLIAADFFANLFERLWVETDELPLSVLQRSGFPCRLSLLVWRVDEVVVLKDLTISDIDLLDFLRMHLSHLVENP